jgi:carbon starvation protein
MNSAYLAAIALLSFYFGYRFYSRFISDKIFGLDEDLTTPAHEFNDSIDFVPTKRHILFGHHFTSIPNMRQYRVRLWVQHQQWR